MRRPPVVIGGELYVRRVHSGRVEHLGQRGAAMFVARAEPGGVLGGTKPGGDRRIAGRSQPRLVRIDGVPRRECSAPVENDSSDGHVARDTKTAPSTASRSGACRAARTGGEQGN